MDFNNYQERTEKFAIYPDRGTGSKAEFSYLALGLVGEAGEVAEKIKKYLRDGTFEPDLIAKEIGDVLWYAARLSDALGCTFGHVAKVNLAKLEDRQRRNMLAGSGDER
jgi:NTP pyrophosphatase (non-canonical NTP hydrolase)